MESKEIDNPAFVPPGQPGFNPTIPPKVTITEETWTDANGNKLSAQRWPDGSIKESGRVTAPNKPVAAAGGAPPVPPGGSSSTEGTPDPSKPNGYDNNRPRKVIKDKNGTVIWSAELEGGDLTAWRNNQQAGQPQTADQEDPVKDRPGWTQITRVVAQGGNKSTKVTYRGPDGKEVSALPEATGSKEEQVTNRPGWVAITRVTGNDTKTTYRGPDGKEVGALPPEAPKDTPTTKVVNGKTYIQHTTPGADGKAGEIYYTDQSGARVSLPDEGIGNIKGLPSYTPDLTKPGAGLIDYAKQLDEYMAAHPEFTWEKRQEVLKNAQTLATQVAGEFNTGAAVLRENFQSQVSQRGQDMTQANSRATLANTHTQNATALIEKFAPYLGVTPGDAGKLFMGMMASQLATATMYGGMKDSPQVQMDPRLMAFADRTVGGAATPPGATPGVSPTPPGTPPNALGLGAMPNPDTALAEQIRAAHRASGAPLPAPILGPNTNMPTAPTPGGAPTAGEPGGPPLQPGPVLGSPANAQAAANAGPVPGQNGSVWTPPPADAQAAANAEPVSGQDPNQWSPPPAPLMSDVPPQPYGPLDYGQTVIPVVPSTDAPGLPSTVVPSVLPSPMRPETLWNPQPAPQAMAPGLSSLFASAFPPTWRQQANDNRDYLAGPMGPGPLVMQSQIPGLTADADAEARRQLAMEMQGVGVA